MDEGNKPCDTCKANKVKPKHCGGCVWCVDAVKCFNDLCTYNCDGMCVAGIDVELCYAQVVDL